MAGDRSFHKGGERARRLAEEEGGGGGSPLRVQEGTNRWLGRQGCSLRVTRPPRRTGIAAGYRRGGGWRTQSQGPAKATSPAPEKNSTLPGHWGPAFVTDIRGPPNRPTEQDTGGSWPRRKWHHPSDRERTLSLWAVSWADDDGRTSRKGITVCIMSVASAPNCNLTGRHRLVSIKGPDTFPGRSCQPGGSWDRVVTKKAFSKWGVVVGQEVKKNVGG